MPSVKQSQEDILASSIEDLEVKEEIGKLKFLFKISLENIHHIEQIFSISTF